MLIKQLFYFITVANLGSITIAADALFISKQSLSESISKLEINDLITCEADIALFAIEPLFLNGGYSELEDILKYLDTMKVF